MISSGRQVREHQSRLRPISTGDSYSAPPPLQGAEPQVQESLERWRQRLLLLPESIGLALMGSNRGISRYRCDQLLQTAGSIATPPAADLSAAQWQQLFDSWQQWLNQLIARHCNLRQQWQRLSPLGRALPLLNPTRRLNLSLARYYGQGLRQAHVNTPTAGQHPAAARNGSNGSCSGKSCCWPAAAMSTPAAAAG